MTKTKESVCITRCDKCGLEQHGLSAARGNCPRCASPCLTPRWIDDPHADTIRLAVTEGNGAPAARLRILAAAADHDRRGDVVLRNQAIAESEATPSQARDFFARVQAGEDAMVAAYRAVAR